MRNEVKRGSTLIQPALRGYNAETQLRGYDAETQLRGYDAEN